MFTNPISLLPVNCSDLLKRLWGISHCLLHSLKFIAFLLSDELSTMVKQSNVSLAWVWGERFTPFPRALVWKWTLQARRGFDLESPVALSAPVTHESLVQFCIIQPQNRFVRSFVLIGTKCGIYVLNFHLWSLLSLLHKYTWICMNSSLPS